MKMKRWILATLLSGTVVLVLFTTGLVLKRRVETAWQVQQAKEHPGYRIVWVWSSVWREGGLRMPYVFAESETSDYNRFSWGWAERIWYPLP